MRQLLVAGLALALMLGASTSAEAQTATNVCGMLVEYRAPTATMPGSITVGPEQFAIDSRATIDMSSDTRIGSLVCLTGTWQRSQTVGRVLTDLRVRSREASAVPTSTPLEKCGVVTAYDFVNVPGTLSVDDVSFVVGLPGGFRRSDVPTLTLPYAAIGLGTGVCVRGLVSPLRTNVWHLLSGEVVVTGRPVTSLPNTGTAPDNRALTLVLLLAVATLFGVRRAIRP